LVAFLSSLDVDAVAQNVTTRHYSPAWILLFLFDEVLFECGDEQVLDLLGDALDLEYG